LRIDQNSENSSSGLFEYLTSRISREGQNKQKEFGICLDIISSLLQGILVASKSA
jgi:hypothetical protein